MTKSDMILDWETLKEEMPKKAELFNMLEEEAMSELVTNKESIPTMLVMQSGLMDVDCVDDLRNDREKFMSLVHYFAEESVYDINTVTENGELCFDVSLDNVGLLWAVSLIYINAVLWHVTGGFPMKLRIHFRNDIARDYTDKMIRDCVLPLFSDIKGYEAVVDEDDDKYDDDDDDGEENIVQKAVEFATVAHTGAVRKGTDIPYIVHPMEVMKIVAGITDDEEVRAAAVLHDTVEDTNVTREDIEEAFGERVAELVASESENKREDEPEEKTWRIRKQETLDHIAGADTDTRIICLGDKLANMRDIARDFENVGDKLWERFNAPEDDNGVAGKKANIGWYYRGIADRLKGELGDTDAWQELDKLVVKVFGLESQYKPAGGKAKLVGYNRKLEEAMQAAYEDQDDEELKDNVLNLIVKSIVAGDKWLIPVKSVEDADEDDIDPEDLPDSMFIGGRDGFVKLTLETENAGDWACAFTSENTVPENTLALEQGCRSIFESFVEATRLDQLCINLGPSQLYFSREIAQDMLDYADKYDFSEVSNEMYYSLDPVAMINTDKIIEDWKKGWKEDFDNEEWKLECYPVMPDGTVLLAFSMPSDIYESKDGEITVTHSHMRYRVLQYKLGPNGPEVINRFRFNAQDGKLGTVYVRDGKLFAVMGTAFSKGYTVLQMFPNNDDAQFKVYSNINRVQSRSNGTLVVSYTGNMYDADQMPVVFYDKDGDIYNGYEEKYAVSCKDMTIDRDENVWFHLYPSKYVVELDDEEMTMDTHEVELQGFNAFALSDDKSRLVAAFDENDDECLLYVMRRDENGDYVSPVRFNFVPRDEDNVIDITDCDYYGCPSICKSTMILRANEFLYWYDVNAFA